MKATKQYFPMVQSIMLYKVVLTFDSVDKILVCNYSNETELLIRVSVYYALQDGSGSIKSVTKTELTRYPPSFHTPHH